jgi:hypothetical protein
MTTEVVPKRGRMSEFDQELADRIYQGIQIRATRTDRGQQAREFRVGISDLGYCSERLNRTLQRQTPADPDMLLAWMGTILGDGLEDAVLAVYPDAIKQASVLLELQGDRRTYSIPGHPDIIIPSLGLVIDGKTSEGLALARRMGADQQKQFQRHGYGKGAWLGGFFGSMPLEEVRVGNVWLDRSGRERCLHVQTEPFSDEVLFNATHWLDEVVTAYEQGTEAMKEPAREVCEQTCGFFADCRLYDTDVSGLIQDPVALEAVNLYLEGKVAATFGKNAKEEAKTALTGYDGSTGRHTVRWVNVNGSEDRAGYSRLDIREIS